MMDQVKLCAVWPILFTKGEEEDSLLSLIPDAVLRLLEEFRFERQLL